MQTTKPRQKSPLGNGRHYRAATLAAIVEHELQDPAFAALFKQNFQQMQGVRQRHQRKQQPRAAG